MEGNISAGVAAPPTVTLGVSLDGLQTKERNLQTKLVLLVVGPIKVGLRQNKGGWELSW